MWFCRLSTAQGDLGQTGLGPTQEGWLSLTNTKACVWYGSREAEDVGIHQSQVSQPVDFSYDGLYAGWVGDRWGVPRLPNEASLWP